jgi:hypothetical protein
MSDTLGPLTESNLLEVSGRILHDARPRSPSSTHRPTIRAYH